MAIHYGMSEEEVDEIFPLDQARHNLKTDIKTKTGRDLDAMVALLIDKWEWCKINPDINGENACEILAPGGALPDGFEPPRKGSMHPAFLVPQYSSRLDLAIELCQRCSFGRIEINGDMAKLPERIVRKCLLKHV